MIGQQIETCATLPNRRGLSARTKGLIDYACKVLAESHPQTLRQLHYAIFSRSEIEYENNEASYKRLSRATTKARRLHRAWELRADDSPCPDNCIPQGWLVDETRVSHSVSVWRDPAEFIDTVKGAYRRDNWADQPNHVELWCEKGTVVGALHPLAKELGVTLRVCKGFASVGLETKVGEYFEVVDKPITVLYLGDHDASGVLIESDIHHRVETASGVRFRMIRLAIHPSDITRFNLPPQKIKDTDTRAHSFRARFGADAATVELDALPADELRRRVRDAVTGLLDLEAWNRAIRVQAVEFNCIAQFAERMRNLPELSAGPARGE